MGYNHNIFNSKEYSDDILRISHQKIVNNEIASDEAINFDKVFQDFTSNKDFHYYHYACTGALAVEAAIKTAFDYKNNKSNKVISFKGSFHGINGYGGIVTDRFTPVNQRLDGYPGSYWKHYDNPVVLHSSRYDNKNSTIRVNKLLDELKKDVIKDPNIGCILIEPIQCTNGDLYFTNDFFIGINNISKEFDIPLIFDEIQTGFCTTGKIWYYQHLPITPDIVIFGKKTQLSGIMVNKKFSTIFKNPIRLEVTWDADLMDMVRCKYIIQAIKEHSIIKKIQKNQLN